MAKFEVEKREAWWFRLIADNGEPILVSRPYGTREEMDAAVEEVRRSADAEVVDEA